MNEHTGPGGNGRPRGTSASTNWQAACKDCARREAARVGAIGGHAVDIVDRPSFEYSAQWSDRVLERGGSRSDRCADCRRAHRDAVRAIAVAYVDLAAIGEVADRQNPTGPLGGLGPLPATHSAHEVEVDLAEFEFRLSDKDILELIDGLADKPGGTTKRVAVLEAGTGTGKSTFGPFRLMNPPPGAAMHLTDNGPIVVTEPRRPAATGVAQFVGESLIRGHEPTCGKHIGPGFTVGYQVSGDKNWDDACQLIYATDGSVINWIREGRLAKIGTVIVDEAHERSENIDLILALLREQLPRYPHLRVIIASATIDKDFFVEYFGGEDDVHYQFVPAVKTFGYGIPLFPGLEIDRDAVAEGLDDGCGGRFPGWSTEQLPESTETLREHTHRMLALRLESAIPEGDWLKLMPKAVADQALRVLEGTEVGDILCFLPKTTMIDDAVRLIDRAVRGTSTKVYPLLAATEDKIKKRALRAAPAGTRKVVVASNLAETSLTVSGVRYVIDSGLICQSEWNPELSRTDVPTKPHSQSGVRQRWGRVGRDAPGWVFPLYDQRQFLDLFPRDTPAGSTRANLETFLIKLKSAGVDDISKIQLPANFAHENYKPDTSGLKAAARFTTEIGRALLSLETLGAVDVDGDLTSLGRELERASGPPEHAIAVMLADRLACVHEVATALALLSNQLVGGRGLMLFDLEWPPAWRLHAHRCHTGLASGCADDLELALRIFSGWQSAPDPEAWARTWWVNHTLLSDVALAAGEAVASLSPAMKQEASRPLDLALLERTRGVLSRALVQQQYRRAAASESQSGAEQGPELWQPMAGDDPDGAVAGYYQLTRPAGPVLAFGRYRPPPRDGEDRKPVIISGLVQVASWALGGSLEPFDLLERASREARPRPATPGRERLDWLRRVLPVGAVIDPDVGVQPLSGPSPYPGDLPDLDSDDDDAAPVTQRRSSWRTNSDAEANGSWGRQSVKPGDVPDDELAAVPLDVRDLEAPEVELPRHQEAAGGARAAAKATTTPTDSQNEESPLLWRWGKNTTPPEKAGRPLGRVVGYNLDEQGRARLILEPVGLAVPVPLEVGDLELGQDVTLTVGGWQSDYRDAFRVLDGDDGLRQYLHPATRGLGGRPAGLASSLQKGDTVTWTIVPGTKAKNAIELSPLPAMRRVVDNFRDRRRNDLVPGVLSPVTDGSTKSGAVVRLAIPGLNPDLAVLAPTDKTLRASKLDRTQSHQVEVRLGPIDGAKLNWPDHHERLETLLAAHGSFLRQDGASIKPTGRPVPRRTVDALLKVKAGVDWQRQVWRFWLQSQQLDVLSIRSAGSELSVELPPWLTTHWSRDPERDRLISEHGLTKVILSDGQLHMWGPPESVTAASAAVAAVIAAGGARIDGGQGFAALFKARNAAHRLQAVREIHEVFGCDVDASGVTVLTGDKSALEAAISRVLSATAVGTMTFADPSRVARFMGRLKTNRNRLLADSGCIEAIEAGRPSTFEVLARSRASLENLHGRVRLIDPGVTMAITVFDLKVTDLLTGAPITTSVVSAPPAQPPAAPTTPTLRETPTRAPVKSSKPLEKKADSVMKAVALAAAELGVRPQDLSVTVLQTEQHTLFTHKLKRQAHVRVTLAMDR